MEEQQVVKEVEEIAEPASVADPKRGETPRQQIRKAKVVGLAPKNESRCNVRIEGLDRIEGSEADGSRRRRSGFR